MSTSRISPVVPTTICQLSLCCPYNFVLHSEFLLYFQHLHPAQIRRTPLAVTYSSSPILFLNTVSWIEFSNWIWSCRSCSSFSCSFLDLGQAQHGWPSTDEMFFCFTFSASSSFSTWSSGGFHAVNRNHQHIIQAIHRQSIYTYTKLVLFQP